MARGLPAGQDPRGHRRWGALGVRVPVNTPYLRPNSAQARHAVVCLYVKTCARPRPAAADDAAAAPDVRSSQRRQRRTGPHLAPVPSGLLARPKAVALAGWDVQVAHRIIHRQASALSLDLLVRG